LNFFNANILGIDVICKEGIEVDFKVQSGFEEEDQNVKSLQYPTIVFPTP
jgi:hypothetical protein